ncbi:ribosomal-protein-alanine N-acetyltransferase [Photobacterium gaetbulicola]|uniref:[Ribosomal protein bS18]-alanine N-acetyltransferase n=1 Tax=Photobacterium gaetbulicola Gung47 TaxID=658445 RepID=A0A0C5WDL0_9GAMM|nr:ribosomal protein S18-alanine N-acetyltransferase [Photobacterium gaetbulicola]AJR09811.1 putative ribosomal-protein-alanine acetyltransferase [Photobacterium gaetbulicola Gung47]PSU12334.1 ribosomal-protein-alanine N-acetyltransferase [Photobacterium gaetbulicola]
MTHNIVTLAPHHLDDVWRIEQAAHAFPWAESLIRKEPNKLALNCGLQIDGRLVGYCFGQLVAGEATLLNIAVDPACQGKGYGKALLEGFITLVEQQKGEEVWLEVRASNTRAYQLYESLGFNEINRREGYYPAENGREDALIMTYMVM